MTRVVMIEITGEDEHQVGVVANFLADEARMSVVFMANAHDHFAELERYIGEGKRPAPFPNVDITNTVLARTT